MTFGRPGDVAVPADYVALGRLQLTTFRPGSGLWSIRTDKGATLVEVFGAAGDRPAPGDYLGLGRAQIAVFRPSTREWLIRTDVGDTLRLVFGTTADDALPVPAAYGPSFGSP